MLLETSLSQGSESAVQLAAVALQLGDREGAYNFQHVLMGNGTADAMGGFCYFGHIVALFVHGLAALAEGPSSHRFGRYLLVQAYEYLGCEKWAFDFLESSRWGAVLSSAEVRATVYGLRDAEKLRPGIAAVAVAIYHVGEGARWWNDTT